MARKETIISPYSHFKEEILILLKKLGFISNYRVEGETIKQIIIDLFYKDGEPVLTDVKIVSRLGQRIYVSYRDLKPVLGGMGWSILSTPKGVMTNKQARREKLGGELLFKIW